MNKNYNLVKMTRDDLKEFIGIGDAFCFIYNGKDYLVQGDMFDVEAQGRVGFYYIQDPDVQSDGSFGGKENHYPESRLYKNAEELMNAAFLDGKTIFERFDELKFFD